MDDPRAAFIGNEGWDPLGRIELAGLGEQPDHTASPRCDQCGYLLSATGHQVTCNG